MHDVCSFSPCQHSVEQTAFHCSAQVSVSILDPLVWKSALPQVTESSAQSSSQSEEDDAEFIKMHMSDRRRWQDGGSAVS